MNNLGIEVTEKWFDSGVDNCFSLSLSAKGGIPTANGKYIELKKRDIEDDKIVSILNKFFRKAVADKLFSTLKSGKTPYDELVLSCDTKSCDSCRYSSVCCYNSGKELNKIAVKFTALLQTVKMSQILL